MAIFRLNNVILIKNLPLDNENITAHYNNLVYLLKLINTTKERNMIIREVKFATQIGSDWPQMGQILNLRSVIFKKSKISPI